MTTTVRLSERTRDRLMQVASQDFGGLSADQALQRLLDEHWERRAVQAMDRLRAEDPDGYAELLGEIEQFDAGLGATPIDPWVDAA